MKRTWTLVATGCCLVALTLVGINSVSAQCSTCPTPVVAFSPVVQPTTVTFTPVTGWYPGRMLDNWRMRRWGFTAPVAATSVAPTTVGFAPTTVGFAPTSTFVPQTVGFAPMVTTVNHVTAFAPLGQRQVLMRPVVVGSPVITSSCSTCAAPAPCSACSACDPCSSCAPAVSQASFVQPACPSCAGGSSITYASPTTSSPMPSSQMSAPSLTPQEAAPLRTDYPPASNDVTPPSNGNSTSPGDPGPASSESSTYFEAPELFNPQDRTALEEPLKPANRAPSVDVWTAVYSKPVTTDNISTATTPRSQAEIDAAGWHSVPADR